MPTRPIASIYAALLVIACAPTARAQDAPAPVAGVQAVQPSRPTTVYELRLWVDLPLILASGIISSSWLLRNELAPPRCAPQCDPSTLASFDRPFAGRYDSGARLVSDLGVGAVVAGSAALLLIDGGFVDLAVGAETLLVTSAVAVVTMMGVRRSRPLAYGDEAPLSARLEGNATLSFPSGHTANAFAATLVAFHMLRARHPRSAMPWIALGVGGAVSSGVGVSRVVAGDHFPSDVLAGACIGAAVGLLVPELHRVAPSLTLGPSGNAALALSGNF